MPRATVVSMHRLVMTYEKITFEITLCMYDPRGDNGYWMMTKDFISKIVYIISQSVSKIFPVQHLC